MRKNVISIWNHPHTAKQGYGIAQSELCKCSLRSMDQHISQTLVSTEFPDKISSLQGKQPEIITDNVAKTQPVISQKKRANNEEHLHNNDSSPCDLFFISLHLFHRPEREKTNM